MKTYQVDLDYESFLFDPAYDTQSSSTLKKQREFEYVFFIINRENCVLKNCRGYSAQYLESLKERGFFIPMLDPNAKEALKWWGHHHDKVTEQTLNSKLTSVKIAKENNWGFVDGALVENEQQMRDHLASKPSIEKWILKSPFGFSGIGHYTFNRKEFKSKITQLMLLEPMYERIFDIGTTFLVKDGVINDWFMVENFNNQSGSFRGGVAAKDKDLFRSYIQKKYNVDLRALEEITAQIVKICLRLGAIDNLQIDSFIYREDGVVKLYPLVEINYRKTMGLVLQSLALSTAHDQLCEWKISSKKEGQSLNLLSPEWTQISPDDNHFLSFYRSIRLD